MNFKQKLKWHTDRSVPIVVVDSAVDEIATVRDILSTYEDDADGYQCLYVWDVSNGLQVDRCRQVEAADTYLAAGLKTLGVRKSTRPDDALELVNLILINSEADRKEYKCGFVFFMGDRIISARDNSDWQAVTQKLLNVRDRLKQQKSCVYLVGIEFTVPAELSEQVAVIQASTPTREEYKQLIEATYEAYSTQYDRRKDTTVPKFQLDEQLTEQFIDTLKGMSQFNAEQTLYLSTDIEGIHKDLLRQRAIQTINSTKGLSVHTGDGSGFAALGGLQAIKDYSTKLLSGNFQPKLVVYVDEVEKSLSGAVGGDTSGVSGNLFGMWLSEMQDTNALGMLLTGVYGCAKSEFAKRLGEEAGTLTVRLDLAGMKDSLVGNSESNMRRALSAIRSIGGDTGGILYVATCNRISQLPPEFKRRFNLGTFFFSFPELEERNAIWKIHRTKYGLPTDGVITVNDTSWTGAEIESCCRLAYLMNCSEAEASKLVVPVADTARHEINQLMEEADGKFLSTSKPGLFIRAKQESVSTAKRGMKL